MKERIQAISPDQFQIELKKNDIELMRAVEELNKATIKLFDLEKELTSLKISSEASIKALSARESSALARGFFLMGLFKVSVSVNNDFSLPLQVRNF